MLRWSWFRIAETSATKVDAWIAGLAACEQLEAVVQLACSRAKKQAETAMIRIAACGNYQMATSVTLVGAWIAAWWQYAGRLWCKTRDVALVGRVCNDLHSSV